jgi:hypothetical protein
LNIEDLKSVITGKTSADAIASGYRGTTLMWLMILEAERSLEFLVGGLRRPASAATEFRNAPGATPLKANVSMLISRGLEQKRAFFAAFLTRNYFGFSVLTRKVAKKIYWGKSIKLNCSLDAKLHGMERHRPAGVLPKRSPAQFNGKRVFVERGAGAPQTNSPQRLAFRIMAAISSTIADTTMGMIGEFAFGQHAGTSAATEYLFAPVSRR